MITPNFQNSSASYTPFPHVRVPKILTPGEADSVLHWLQSHAPWKLRVESFYEQHEFSLLKAELAGEVSDFISPAFIEQIAAELMTRFSVESRLLLVDVAAHRLTPGQTIRIHNDYIGEDETHRLLIQLNDGWDSEKGGLLMLFAGSQPESLRTVVMPVHGSGFAFEISPLSFHAVSSIKDSERYTLVYTFRKRH